MATTLTSKGQVTMPKRIRDAMQLVPGMPVVFSVNAAGDVVLHPARPAGRTRKPARCRPAWRASVGAASKRQSQSLETDGSHGAGSSLTRPSWAGVSQARRAAGDGTLEGMEMSVPRLPGRRLPAHAAMSLAPLGHFQ